MSSNVDELVQRLCREIPEEKDPEKMMKMVEQLNRLLDEKEAGRSNPYGGTILVKNGGVKNGEVKNGDVRDGDAQVAQDLPFVNGDSGRRKSA